MVNVVDSDHRTEISTWTWCPLCQLVQPMIQRTQILTLKFVS